MNRNPYAAPATDGDEGQPEPTDGARAWADGKMLVIRRDGAALPAFCFRTGVPATKRENRTLRWNPPWAYAVAFLGVIAWKTAHLEFALGDEAVKRRRKKSLIAFLVSFGGFALFPIGIQFPSLLPLVILAIPLIGAGLIYASAHDRIGVVRMTDRFAWVRGAHPQLLERLPVWTGGRP